MRRAVDKLLRRNRKPFVRPDYRTFDMRRMKGWGNNAFWWPRERAGERACLFGPRPQVGDVLIEDDEVVYAITESRTPSDPGDQHFVTVAFFGALDELPPSQRGSSWVDGLV